MLPDETLAALPAVAAFLPCLLLGALTAIGVEVVCTRHARRRAATGADAIAVHGTESGSADASEAEAARLTVHVGFSGAAVVLIRPRVAAATLSAGPAAASHSRLGVHAVDRR